jgi:hypothetical protein
MGFPVLSQCCDQMPNGIAKCVATFPHPTLGGACTLALSPSGAVRAMSPTSQSHQAWSTDNSVKGTPFVVGITVLGSIP